MKTGLYQTISPGLVMTPRMHQAITLLQLPNLELLFRIRQELVLNPFLEEAVLEDNTEMDSSEEKELYSDKMEKEEDLRLEELEEMLYSRTPLPYEKEERKEYERPVPEKATLYQHLIWQLHLSKLSFEEVSIGEIIVSEIDDRGYLAISLHELSNTVQIPSADLEKVLKVIQTFDPVGVGARDLKECLLLQLNRESDIENFAAVVIENFMEEVKNRDFSKIANALNVELEKVMQSANLIAKLNPVPGDIFEDVNLTNYYITPDVVVDKIGNEYVVSVNDDGLPKLRLNNYYLKMLNHKEKFDSEVKEFLLNKFRSANWFLEAIEQRRMTLFRVASTIIKKQEMFLEKGEKYFSPLSQKEIAEMLDIHESTVSRTVNKKYIQMPAGIFELKSFFSGGFRQAEGKSSVSSVSIKEMIRDIIEKEERTLTDEEIGNILKRKGIGIARRTVTKYRDELKIPGLNRRKMEGKK